MPDDNFAEQALAVDAVPIKRYRGTVTMGLVGCNRTFEFECEADASDDAIDEAAREAMLDCIEWGYEPIETKKE